MEGLSELVYEILENICTWEGVDHPECIGDEREVAKQFEISVDDATKALRNLKAFGFIEECKATHSKHHDEKLAIEIGFFDPESRSFCSTLPGRRAVKMDEESYKGDMN